MNEAFYLPVPDSPAASERTEEPYRLTVTEGPCPTVCVLHDERCRLRWAGELARRLIDRQPLPNARLRPGTYPLSKKQVQCIALVAAALEIQLDTEYAANEVDARIAANERLGQRLRALNLRIPTAHKRVARRLFHYPSVHFREEDIVCLLSLEYAAVHPERLRNIAIDLAAWGIVQRLEVDGIAFYDIDTRPHLHLYKADTGELVDAPASGVLQVS